MRSVVFNVSGICNLKCSYCDLKLPKLYVSFKQFVQEMEQYDPKDTYLIFSGGEPTLNEDLQGMLIWCYVNNYSGQIITNGTLIQHIDVPPNFRVNLSLSCVNPDRMDKKDKLTLSVLDKIKATVSLSIVFTNNFEDTKETIEFAIAKGYDVNLNIPVQFDPNLETAYHRLTEINIPELTKLIGYYTEIYQEHWFIHPDTLVFLFTHLINKTLWVCDRVQEHVNYVLPNLVTWKCSKTSDLQNCQGCLDVCTLEEVRRTHGLHNLSKSSESSGDDGRCH